MVRTLAPYLVGILIPVAPQLLLNHRIVIDECNFAPLIDLGTIFSKDLRPSVPSLGRRWSRGSPATPGWDPCPPCAAQGRNGYTMDAVRNLESLWKPSENPMKRYSMNSHIPANHAKLSLFHSTAFCWTWLKSSTWIFPQSFFYSPPSLQRSPHPYRGHHGGTARHSESSLTWEQAKASSAPIFVWRDWTNSYEDDQHWSGIKKKLGNIFGLN